jgi:hypothetical protein
LIQHRKKGLAHPHHCPTGLFDLDPNRVLDIVLDVCEARPQAVAMWQLVKLFNPAFVPHIVAFKFSHYQVRFFFP